MWLNMDSIGMILCVRIYVRRRRMRHYFGRHRRGESLMGRPHYTMVKSFLVFFSFEMHMHDALHQRLFDGSLAHRFFVCFIILTTVEEPLENPQQHTMHYLSWVTLHYSQPHTHTYAVTDSSRVETKEVSETWLHFCKKQEIPLSDIQAYICAFCLCRWKMKMHLFVSLASRSPNVKSSMFAYFMHSALHCR